MVSTLFRDPQARSSALATLGTPQPQGGVTHIGAVYIAATGVKMWSNSQGVVKRSSSIPGPITYR